MNEKKTVFADSHVHIYDCYDIKRFIKSAVSNFNKAHNDLKLTEKFAGILFLTEAGSINYFKKIFNQVQQYSDLLRMNIERTSEDDSLRFNLESGNYIVLISGQQIITKENIELLALGTVEKFNCGEDLISSVKKIKEKDAVPVIPWGVGKWFGKRGKIVGDIIQNSKEIFLGDNSGRPFLWPYPKLFREGNKKNIFTLRGSDPLPLNNQEKKAGSFGFYFVSEFDLDFPSRFLKNYLRSREKEPQNYGKLESFSNFFKNQFLIQARKTKS